MVIASYAPSLRRNRWECFKENLFIGFKHAIEYGFNEAIRDKKPSELEINYFGFTPKSAYETLDRKLTNLQEEIPADTFHYMFKENSEEEITTYDLFNVVYCYKRERDYQISTKEQMLNQISDFKRVINYILEGKPLFLIRKQAIEFQNFLGYLSLEAIQRQKRWLFEELYTLNK